MMTKSGALHEIGLRCVDGHEGMQRRAEMPPVGAEKTGVLLDAVGTPMNMCPPGLSSACMSPNVSAGRSTCSSEVVGAHIVRSALRQIRRRRRMLRRTSSPRFASGSEGPPD